MKRLTRFNPYPAAGGALVIPHSQQVSGIEVLQYDDTGRALKLSRFDITTSRRTVLWQRTDEWFSSVVLAFVLVAAVAFIAGRVTEAVVRGAYSVSSVRTLSSR